MAPLWKLCRDGKLDEVRSALERGEDVNDKEDLGGHRWTALMYAVSGRHNSIVKLLLDQPGVKINVKNNDGRTALHLAAGGNNREAARMLLLHRTMNQTKANSKDNDGRTAVMWAVIRGREELLRELVAHESSESDGQYFKAGRSNNVSQFKETDDLIFKNGEVDLKAEFTPDGKLKCFFCPQELKQVKRHINGKHETELQDQAALEQFCQKVAEKWKREKQSKYNESRKEKQKDYMKVNEKNNDGWTALHYAAWNNKRECARMLLLHPTMNSANEKNDSDETAVMIAVRRGHEEVLSELVSHGSVSLDIGNVVGSAR